MRRAAQRVRPSAGSAELQHEYGFLVGCLIDRATLERAEWEAAQQGVTTHAVLLATGWVRQAAYAAALGRALGVRVVHSDLALAGYGDSTMGLDAWVDGRPCRVLCASEASPANIHERVAFLRSQGIEVVLATQASIDAVREVRVRGAYLDHAVRGLLREQPEISAGTRTRSWQIVFAFGILGATLGGLYVFPEAAVAAVTGLIALPFLCVTCLRLVALRQALGRSPARKRMTHNKTLPRLPDHSLPIYSVLVPLLREGNVLARLVQSLRAFDYPVAKLEVILVLEAGDTETQAALRAIDLPANFRALVVPSLAPQTKPKALNFALPFARGEFVVVYDAEDRPEARQLRDALEVFRTGGRNLVCVQAQLNIYNPYRSWLTRGLMAQTPLEVNPSPA